MPNQSLVDPIETAPVQQEAPAPQPEVKQEEPSELRQWAQSKGFDASVPESFLKSYKDMEQDYGRLRNEVGESRKLMDRVIALEETRQTPEVTQEPEVQLDATDLIANPKETLDAYFEQREARLTKQYEERIAQLEGQVGRTQLSAKHTDAGKLVNDPSFLRFVEDSPTRTLVAQQAVQNGDVNALDALLTEYKQAGSANPEPAVTSTPAVDPGQAGLQAAAQASLESNNPSGGNPNAGKVYLRSDIVRKKIEDPEGWLDPTYQDEILRAYAEGRVK